MMETIVGVDVSKGRPDVFVLPAGKSFAIVHDQAGLVALWNG
jgi:hypothetical protein